MSKRKLFLRAKRTSLLRNVSINAHVSKVKSRYREIQNRHLVIQKWTQKEKAYAEQLQRHFKMFKMMKMLWLLKRRNLEDPTSIKPFYDDFKSLAEKPP